MLLFDELLSRVTKYVFKFVTLFRSTDRCGKIKKVCCYSVITLILPLVTLTWWSASVRSCARSAYCTFCEKIIIIYNVCVYSTLQILIYVHRKISRRKYFMGKDNMIYFVQFFISINRYNIYHNTTFSTK